MTAELLIGFKRNLLRARPGNTITFGRSPARTLCLDPEGANLRLHRECGRFVAVAGQWTVENRGSNLKLEIAAKSRLTVPPWPPASRHLQPPAAVLLGGTGRVSITAAGTTYTLTWEKTPAVETAVSVDPATPLDGWATAAEKEVLLIWTQPWRNGDRTARLSSAQTIAEVLTRAGKPVERSAVEARLASLGLRLAKEGLLATARGGAVRGPALAGWVLDHHIIIPDGPSGEEGR